MKNDQPEWMTYAPLKWVPAPPPVILSRLSPKDKHQLWQAIKRHKPALANMMTTDPAVDLIMREFNASLALGKTEFDQLMAAEQQHS